MAKTTKKTTKATVKKETVVTSMKEPVKKLTTEPEKKKITAKPEAKKLTVSKEPEKISVAKEPEKIAAKPEPKKLETKETLTLETKKEPVTKKTTEKKPAKKASVKKEATKKEVKKEVAKKEVAPKKEVAKKEAVKKSPAKKATTKKEKPATKKANDKIEKMTNYSLDECISLLQAMGVMHSYDDYKSILLDESDIAIVEKNIINGNRLTERTFDFENDGYDIELVAITLQKVADTMDIKASDYPAIKKDMEACVKTKYTKDDEKNAKEYLKEFKIAEKILMIAQRKNITNSLEVSELLNSDVDAFVKHFFDLAFEILPTWQYEDVKFYEDFAYAMLSQYADLYDKYQLRILIDCADLYIVHGDFLHGDESYGYILRDNQIKDYIYYRFASVYENIDMNKAKGLAYESLQYVDDRYTFYPNIMEILNK